MLLPYRNPTNGHKRKQKISNTNLDDNSNRDHDLKRPQVISIRHQMTSKHMK